MLTTIQLNETVKMQLNRMKNTNKQTYEDVIVEMINKLEKQKRKKINLLKEGYREMQKEIILVNKEWSSVDADWD